MTKPVFIFNQLVQCIPKDVFERLVKKYRGNANVQHFSCWNLLMVMLWAQYTNRRSLGDIESSLRVHSDKIYRMGMGRGVSRNNIANANSKRDVVIYREMALKMMQKCSKLSCRDQVLADIGKLYGIDGFYAVDSSTISLDLDRFQWSVPQEG